MNLYLGDIESDEKSDNEEKNEEVKKVGININHDDLSDVSDLDESIGGPTDNEEEVDEKKEEETESQEKEAKKVRL